MLDEKNRTDQRPPATTPHGTVPHATTERPVLPPDAGATHLSHDAVPAPRGRSSTSWLAAAGAAVVVLLLVMWMSGGSDPVDPAFDPAPADVESSATAPAGVPAPETAPAVDPAATAPEADLPAETAPPAADPSN
jgi:hypothetical protein